MKPQNGQKKRSRPPASGMGMGRTHGHGSNNAWAPSDLTPPHRPPGQHKRLDPKTAFVLVPVVYSSVSFWRLKYCQIMPRSFRPKCMPRDMYSQSPWRKGATIHISPRPYPSIVLHPASATERSVLARRATQCLGLHKSLPFSGQEQPCICCTLAVGLCFLPDSFSTTPVTSCASIPSMIGCELFCCLGTHAALFCAEPLPLPTPGVCARDSRQRSGPSHHLPKCCTQKISASRRRCHSSAARHGRQKRPEHQQRALLSTLKY